MMISSLEDEYINTGLYKLVGNDETVEDVESFFLTPLTPNETGLPMCVNLRCLENKNELPFLRFQNDRESVPNYNWIKMYIDGTLHNYENKAVIFTDNELQSLKNWIVLNKAIIIKHYYQEYDSCDVCKLLKKVRA